MNRTINAIKDDLPVWMLGAAFALLGTIMAGAGYSMYQYQDQWSHAITTTGRVIVTEWKKEKKEDKLQIRYAYKDDLGIIYHNGAVLPRKLGKLNLEPGAAIVVLYRPEDHGHAALQLQLGGSEWIPLLALGVLELAAGGFFLAVCSRRLRLSLALYSKGVVKPGKVVALEDAHSRLKRVVCEYEASDGRTYRAKSQPVSADKADCFSLGQMVNVRALLDKPDIAVVDVESVSSTAK